MVWCDSSTTSRKSDGNVIEQRGRGFTRETAGHVARIVFDAVAIANRAHHFDIEECALRDALRFDDFPLAR